MKRVLLITLLLSLIATAVISDSKEVERQRFEVKFIITYNAITLSEAAETEITIKKMFDDACSIKIKVNKASSGIGFSTIRTDTL